MDKDREDFLLKVEKLLECDGIIILKGSKSWVNFLNTFFPGDEGVSMVYKLKNMHIRFSENPTLRTINIVDLG